MCASRPGSIASSNKNPFLQGGQRWNNSVSAPCFRVVIQRHFHEMVDLPKPSVWNSLPNCLHSCLLVSIRRHRRQSFFFFLSAEPKFSPSRCVLTSKGYLLVYVKEKELKGYAVNVSQARQIKVFSGSASKEFCLIKITWHFGGLLISLYKHQIAEWCSKILCAFNCSSYPSECLSPPIALKDVATQVFATSSSSDALEKEWLNGWNAISSTVKSSHMMLEDSPAKIRDSYETNAVDSLEVSLTTPSPSHADYELEQLFYEVQPLSVKSSSPSSSSFSHTTVTCPEVNEPFLSKKASETSPFVSLLRRYGDTNCVVPYSNHKEDVSSFSVREVKEMFENREMPSFRSEKDDLLKAAKETERCINENARNNAVEDSVSIAALSNRDRIAFKNGPPTSICLEERLRVSDAKERAEKFTCDSRDISSYWQTKVFESYV